MKTDQVKEYLEQELPDFKYKTDEENNPNAIWIERDGQKLVMDVHKVEGKREAKQLVKYISSKWEAYENNKDMV